MPIPKPRGNESNKDFISRCMADSVMVSEYDEAQRYAICNSQLEKMGQEKVTKDKGIGQPSKAQIKTVEMIGSEIAKSGKWEAMTGDIEIKESDFDEMITNFKNGVMEPYLNLDHDDNFTDKVKDSLKVLALGFIQNLYKKGTSLYADFKQVPEKIADLIKSGQLKQKSIEFYKKVKIEGKVYNNVLKAVSFFGANVPAINGLSDYIEVLYEHKENETIILKNFVGGSNVEITQEKYEELVKAQNDLNFTVEKLKSIEDKNKELEKEFESVKKEKEKIESETQELQKLKEKIEKDKKEKLKNDAESYISELVKSGKILPKFKYQYINDYIEKSKDEDIFKLFKEDLESRGTIVNLGKIEYAGDDGKISDDEYEDAEKIEENIQKYMKANKKDYKTASIELGYMTDEEV